MNDLKHKTVGVSFHPELRERAMARAKALGLSFSRYVAQCVETDLGDRPSPLNAEAPSAPSAEGLSLEAAIDAGGEYGAAKARSIAFEEDVEAILRAEEVCYERLASVAHLRTDFLIQHAVEHRDEPHRIALECKHSVKGRETLVLGQLIVLRSLPMVDAVILCLPYTRNVDAHLRKTFAEQNLPLATPDNLVEVLTDLCEALTTPPR